MKNVIVTGGAGFIGSWLCEQLLNERYNVTCIDNFCTGREKNLSHLQKEDNFRLINADVINFKDYDINADFIFHLASPASPPFYQRLSLETLLVNSLGTLNMLELARKNNARFLYTSTSEVYGNPSQTPQKETYWGNVNPNGIRSMYDESKRFGEALCMDFMRKQGIDIRIVRIFNTYGERMRADDGRVVSNFINQAIGNNPITVYGKGDQTRSLCYVSDLAGGLMKFMFTENLKGNVINLGNPDEKTILELANIIKKITDSKSEIIFKELPKDDPERRCPDITLAKRLLHWEPAIGLEEGLNKTIEWYKKEK